MVIAPPPRYCHNHHHHTQKQHLAMTLRAAHAAIASEPFAAALDGEYHLELLALVQQLAARADARAAGVGQGEL